MILEENEFLLFRKFIYELSGIYFDDRKKFMLERRLKRRMEDLGCSTFREYYYLLKSDTRRNEVYNLINIVTTNETYFFRNIPQIKILGEELLPILMEEKKARGDYNLKLWSTACSTGEEPYTLAITTMENLGIEEKWNVQILASDINKQVIKAARRGKYGSRSVKDVHNYYISRYFHRENGCYEVAPHIRRLVRFFNMNIIDEKRMGTIRNIDVIFCRNVLIYFDVKSQRKAVDLLYDSLCKGGYIFLGHSESMSRITTAFKLVKFKNGIIYKKE